MTTIRCLFIMNKYFLAKVLSILLGWGFLLNFPAIAQLPNRKNLIDVGVLFPGTTSATNNYIEPNSIVKEDEGYDVYFLTWAFWHYKSKNGTVATQSLQKANCLLWTVTQLKYQGFDVNGKPTHPIYEPQEEVAREGVRGNVYIPENTYNKMLNVVCK